MNIAHLLPYTARFPLVNHNGRYDWVLRLANLQAAQEQGHKVTIYAAPGSYDKNAPSIQWANHGTAFDNQMANNIANIKAALQAGHDIYHSHLDYAHYLVADTTTKPIVVTQHWSPNNTIAHAATLNVHRNAVAVPVTHYMAMVDKQLGIPAADVIYHGIDLGLFHPTGRAKTNRFIFVGRITPDKGVKEAVAIAKAAGIALDIVGKVNAVDQPYWQSVLPDVDGAQIRYVGALTQTEVATLLAGAKAMIFPPQAIEAFGQTIIEAQACGTPVITEDRGAASELIQHGKTGFVASTKDEYLAAIRDINTVDPVNCRTFAEQFSVDVMANGYMSLYEKLLSGT